MEKNCEKWIEKEHGHNCAIKWLTCNRNPKYSILKPAKINVCACVNGIKIQTHKNNAFTHMIIVDNSAILWIKNYTLNQRKNEHI